MKNKSLDDLYEYREKLQELIKYAKSFGGEINLGDEIVKQQELEEELKNVKVEIASRISQNPLRVVKKDI